MWPLCSHSLTLKTCAATNWKKKRVIKRNAFSMFIFLFICYFHPPPHFIFFFFFFCVWYSLHIQNSTICCVHKIRIERSGQKMAIADTNIQHKSTFMIVNGFVLAKWRLIDNYYQKPNKSWFFIFHFGSIQQCFALYTKLKIAHLKALPSIIWFSLLVFSALFSLCWYLSLFPIYASFYTHRSDNH